MSRTQLRLWLATLCAIQALVIGYLLAPNSGYFTVEERWMDSLMVWKIRFSQPPSMDSRIKLIGIDDRTISSWHKPSIFWDEELAKLSIALVDAGAQVVGLDWISNVPTSGLSPGLAAEVSQTQSQMLQALLTEKVVLLDLPDTNLGKGFHPHPNYYEVASHFNNVANGIVVPGSDGVVRRILSWTETNGLKQPAFALRLANADLTKVEEKARLNWQRTTFPWISAGDILDKVNKGEKLTGFEGAICLIGPASVSLGDLKNSALDLLPGKAELGGALGPELHATAIENSLSGNFLVAYPAVMSMTLSLVFAGLYYLLAYRLRVNRSFVGAGVLLVLYFGAYVCCYLNWTLWLPLTPVMVAAFNAYFLGYVWRYFEVERQRNKTKRLFSQLVAPQVVDKILEETERSNDGQRLGGTFRRVTVLYTDINDFTPVCERHSPAEVIILLNEYFKDMVDIIFANEGMLKQFVGDEIMVIFGAPAEQPDHAARAVKTGVEMLEVLKKRQQEKNGQEGFFDIKIGIHTGDVVVGYVGSSEHMEYAAVGDDVNLGARIMSATKGLGVKMLVSAVTKAESEKTLPHLKWKSQGVQSFKGKTAQMEVFEVMSEKE